jgi:hypothetical protein
VTAAESEVPIAMKKVYWRLERWRSRRTGRSKIPESIWMAAGALAREHGVNRVSQVLHLEFNHLKRMAASSERITKKRSATTPAFVELIAPQAGGRPCVIEIEGERGKLHIELNGSADEVASVSRSLWEMLA